MVVEGEGIPPHCPFYCDEKCQRSSLWIDMGVAGVLSGLTIIVSIVNVYLHLSHFNNPYFQSKIISKNIKSRSYIAHGTLLLHYIHVFDCMACNLMMI